MTTYDEAAADTERLAPDVERLIAMGCMHTGQTRGEFVADALRRKVDGEFIAEAVRDRLDHVIAAGGGGRLALKARAETVADAVQAAEDAPPPADEKTFPIEHPTKGNGAKPAAKKPAAKKTTAKAKAAPARKTTKKTNGHKLPKGVLSKYSTDVEVATSVQRWSRMLKEEQGCTADTPVTLSEVTEGIGYTSDSGNPSGGSRALRQRWDRRFRVPKDGQNDAGRDIYLLGTVDDVMDEVLQRATQEEEQAEPVGA